MKIRLSAILLLVACLLPLSMNAAELSEQELQFLANVAAHYEVDAEKILGMLQEGNSLEDVPVAFRVNKLDGSNPKTLLGARAQGDSWGDILKNRSQVRADSFYMLIAGEVKSPVYGPIMAKYKDVNPDQWRSIQLSDEEIINLVNLRFLSSHHDYSVFEVMKLRDGGKSFVDINVVVAEMKEKMIKEQKEKLRNSQ